MFYCNIAPPNLHAFPTRRSSDLFPKVRGGIGIVPRSGPISLLLNIGSRDVPFAKSLTWLDDVRASAQLGRSEEHTSELQSLRHLVCRLPLAKKNYECI